MDPMGYVSFRFISTRILHVTTLFLFCGFWQVKLHGQVQDLEKQINQSRFMVPWVAKSSSALPRCALPETSP